MTPEVIAVREIRPLRRFTSLAFLGGQGDFFGATRCIEPITKLDRVAFNGATP